MKKSIVVIILAVLIIVLLVVMFYNASRPKGLVAFVIDDWGYNKRNIDLALEIDRPLTISILPNLRYSKYVAEEFAKANNAYDNPASSAGVQKQQGCGERHYPQ
ncbi:MAG: hypothetical protein HQ532_03335 [Candidatus Omnitrophica bacterium]|nr:hypothetical protein [Candidatus Omnitrophota bacterium]